jgi:hypothetical protein
MKKQKFDTDKMKYDEIFQCIHPPKKKKVWYDWAIKIWKKIK